MSKKTIEITFDFVTGGISAEASGYVGNACSLDINEVMKDLGKITRRRMKKDDKARKVARTQKA